MEIILKNYSVHWLAQFKQLSYLHIGETGRSGKQMLIILPHQERITSVLRYNSPSIEVPKSDILASRIREQNDEGASSSKLVVWVLLLHPAIQLQR